MKETNVRAEFDFSYEEGHKAGYASVFRAARDGVPYVPLPMDGPEEYLRGFIEGVQDAIAWQEGYRAAKAGLKAAPYDKDDEPTRWEYWVCGYQAACQLGHVQPEGRA